MFTATRTARSLRSATLALTLFGAVSLASPDPRGLFQLATPAFAEADVVVENLSFDTGIGILKIPRLEANGSVLSADEITAMMSGKGVGSLTDQLSRLTASSIYVPEIIFEQKMAGVEQTVRYYEVSLSDVASGKVGRMKVGKTTIISNLPIDPSGAAAPGGFAMTGEVAAMTADGVDMQAMARVFTEKSSGPNEPLATLYESFSIEGYRIQAAGVMDIKLGRSTGHEFKMRPLKVSFSELMASMPKPKTDGTPPSPEETKAAMAMVTNLIDIYYAFSMKDSDTEGLEMSIGGGPGGPALGSMKIGRMYMADYVDAKLGEFKMEGFSIAPPGQGVIELGVISLKGLDLSKSLKGMVDMIALAGAADPSLPPPQPTPDQMAAMMPTFDAFTIGGVKLDFVPPPSETNPAPAPVKMELGEFTIEPKAWLGFVPTSLQIVVDGFKMAVDPNDPNMAQLAAVGLKTIDLSSKIDYAWDEAGGRLSINDLGFDIANFGKFSAKGTLDGVTKDAFSVDPLVQQAALGAALLKGIEIEVENDGMIELMIAQQAAQQGRTVEEVKAELIGAAAGAPSMFLGTDPKAIDIGNALSKFLSDPKKLKIKAASDAGVGMIDMFTPDQILKKTTIEITPN